jgi:uncharacterized protein YjbI with pentapeptide repeats
MGLLRLFFARSIRQVGQPLDRIESEERIRKLRAETAMLEFQASPRGQRREYLKTVAGVGALITGFAALLGIAVSVYQYVRAADATREVRIEERLDRALALLGSETAATRLAGVVSLTSFLSVANERQSNQSLLAITRAVGLEPSAAVRGAIVSTLSETNRLSEAQRNTALSALVQVSRALVEEGRLRVTWRERGNAAPAHESAEARAISVTTAIQPLLRAGARIQDMSGIYLVGADLSRVNLDGTLFRDSILANTNFTSASLVGASFEDADLQGVSFHSALLKRANFRSASPYESDMEVAYVSAQLRALTRDNLGSKDSTIDIYVLDGPDFTCADLTESDFTGHPIYVWAESKIPRDLGVGLDTSFQWSRLKDAKFADPTSVGITSVKSFEHTMPFPSSRTAVSDLDGGYMIVESVIGAVEEVEGEHGIYVRGEGRDTIVAKLMDAFEGSDWGAAEMPDALVAALPPSDEEFASKSPCAAQSFQ